jgi:hypothetical protein
MGYGCDGAGVVSSTDMGAAFDLDADRVTARAVHLPLEHAGEILGREGHRKPA